MDLLDGDVRARMVNLLDAAGALPKNAPLPPTLRADAEELLAAQRGSSQSLRENGESLLVALIVAMAIRTFFLQPFSIPTNSMWPNYRGIGIEFGGSDGPLRSVLRGSRNRRILAPDSGTVTIPLNDLANARRQGSILPYEIISRRRLGIWTARLRRYHLLVNNRPVPVVVPEEFDMENLLVRRFFPDLPATDRLLGVLRKFPTAYAGDRPVLSTGCRVSAGEPVLAFSTIHGDVLLVDRLTPNFLPIRRGRALVFATRSVPALHPDDRYYIKRLAGTGGNSLCILDGQIWVDGAAENWSGTGYVALGFLESSPVTVPADHCFVLGDNSANSFDSRFFGPIPTAAIIGRPLFRIYPLKR
jgi:signal peptidase I